MFQKILLASLFFFFSSNLSAQNEVSKNHYLQWGKITIPIGELVNGSNGRITLKLSEVLESANEPIFLIKNGEDEELKSFYFIVSKNKSAAPPNFVRIENYDKKDASRLHGKAYLKENLKEGELIYLRNLKGNGLVEYSLSIKIKYENAPLQLGFEIPDIPKGEVFGFQIVDYGNETTQVKLDTSDLKNERIFNTYKKLKNYEIVHIPNFKTTRRYITKKDKIEFENEQQVNWVQDEKLKKLDLEKLSEFSNYDGSNIELKWGDMNSSTSLHSTTQIRQDITIESTTGSVYSFQAYDIYDLENALESRFMLSQGFQSLEIVRFKVVILTNEDAPVSFIIDDIKNEKLKQELEKIPAQSTILFTDILIKNQKGDFHYFPPSFLFGFQ